MTKFKSFPRGLQSEIIDYVDDVGADWNPKESLWELATVPLKELTKASWRLLPSLKIVDMTMADEGSRTPKAPIVLDSDFSVIDGMHRLAVAIRNGQKFLRAFVRVEEE